MSMDRLEHRVQIGQDFMIPKSGHSNTRSFNLVRPLSIIRVLFVGIMPSTIQFDCQLLRVTVKVDYVASDRILPAKFKPAEAKST